LSFCPPFFSPLPSCSASSLIVIIPGLSLLHAHTYFHRLGLRLPQRNGRLLQASGRAIWHFYRIFLLVIIQWHVVVAIAHIRPRLQMKRQKGLTPSFKLTFTYVLHILEFTDMYTQSRVRNNKEDENGGAFLLYDHCSTRQLDPSSQPSRYAIALIWKSTAVFLLMVAALSSCKSIIRNIWPSRVPPRTSTKF
jgi:hypothetical protein